MIFTSSLPTVKKVSDARAAVVVVVVAVKRERETKEFRLFLSFFWREREILSSHQKRLF